MRFLKRLGLRPALPSKVDIGSLTLKLIAVTSAFYPIQAFAQDWSAPATSMLESLEGGLVSIAAPVIGVGVIIYGIWAMVTGRIDIMRLAQLVGAGALVIFGPTALRALLSAA